MPSRFSHPCNQPGCPAVTKARYCATHAQQAKQQWQREQEAIRPNARERGYDSRWEKARKAYLAQHPLCVQCKAEGRVKQATVVDHVIPHRGDKRLFWDSSKWAALCEAHHNQKTHREMGERRKQRV